MIGQILVIIEIVGLIICVFGLGFYAAKIHALKKFEEVMDKIHDKALSTDFSNDYNCGYSHGLVDAIKMIQDGDVF